MGKLLGQRWIQKHGTTPSREWVNLLAPFTHFDPQQSAAQLVKRIKPNDRGEVWPPEMADVIAMLTPRPEDHGLPTPDRAFKAAAHQTWSLHPVVFEAAHRVGVFELRMGGASRREFDQVYAQVCEEFITGRTESWQKRSNAHQLTNRVRPAWMDKHNPGVAPFDFSALRKSLGPMPKPLTPDTPPAPVNDEDFDRLQAEQRDVLAQAAERYQGRGV